MKIVKCLWVMVFAVEISALLSPEASGNPQFLSPENIARTLRHDFQFKDDQELFGQADYWQAPDEFRSRKAGDCEDYALFAQEELLKLGLEAFVVSIYGEAGYAHTVAVFKRDGKYSVINEDRLLDIRVDSLEEAVGRINSHWTWASIAERKKDRGWPVQKFWNPTESHEPALDPLPL